MPSTYTTRFERRGELLVVTVTEVVDLAAMAAIRRAVVREFLKDEARGIVVDLRGMTPVLSRTDWTRMCAGSAMPVLPKTVPVVFVTPPAFSKLAKAYVSYLRSEGLVRFTFSTPAAALRVAANLRDHWPATPCPLALARATDARSVPEATIRCLCTRCPVRQPAESR